MSLFAEQDQFMGDLAKLIAFAHAQGMLVSGRELGRTAEQQAIYVRAGRSKTMKSNHLRNCAIDLYFMRNGQLLQTVDELRALGTFWCALSPKNEWGGNWKSFKDLPHFERRP